MEPKNGKCCACSYEGEKETVCSERDDRAHCEHWWDGPDGEYEKTFNAFVSAGLDLGLEDVSEEEWRERFDKS